jgi:hypothetical protein
MRSYLRTFISVLIGATIGTYIGRAMYDARHPYKIVEGRVEWRYSPSTTIVCDSSHPVKDRTIQKMIMESYYFDNN